MSDMVPAGVGVREQHPDDRLIDEIGQERAQRHQPVVDRVCDARAARRGFSGVAWAALAATGCCTVSPCRTRSSSLAPSQTAPQAKVTWPSGYMNGLLRSLSVRGYDTVEPSPRYTRPSTQRATSSKISPAAVSVRIVARVPSSVT